MCECNVLTCACGGGKYYFPQRYLLVTLSAFAIIIMYGHRLNISLIITEMVQKDPTAISPDCLGDKNVTESPEKENKTGGQSWTEKNQGVILAAFYVGYFPAHFPAGILADDFGARYIITTSVLLSTITTAVAPVIVKYTNWWIFAILRCITGITQGALLPTQGSLLSCWIPREERATMGGIVFAANAFGLVFGPLLTGAVQQAANSWEMTFYFWTVIGLVWYAIAMVYLFSDPQSHPFITPREKTYLLGALAKREKTLKRNWHLILIDVPLWALVFGQFGHSYLIFFLCTNMPKYFKDVLHVNFRNNTLASSLPYVLQWITSVASGKFGDWMIKNKKYDVSLIRKIYTTIASVFPSLAILAMPFSGCSVMWVIVWLSLSLFFMGPFYCGLKVNIMDVTVNFAGLIMAIVNGIGAIAGAVNPVIVSNVAADNTLDQWKIVGWIIVVVASVTNIIYFVFGTAMRSRFDYSKEDWETEKQRRKEKAEEKTDQKQAEKEEKEAKKVAEKEAKKTEKEAKKAEKEAKKTEKEARAGTS